MCRILKLNGWSMVTSSTTDSGLAVRWIKFPKINAKAILLNRDGRIALYRGRVISSALRPL